MRLVGERLRLDSMPMSMAADFAVESGRRADTMMMDRGQGPTTNQVGDERQRGNPTLHEVISLGEFVITNPSGVRPNWSYVDPLRYLANQSSRNHRFGLRKSAHTSQTKTRLF